MVKELCLLSNRILTLANKGTPRMDFLQEVAKILLDFSGCEAIEMWLNEENRFYRFEARVDAEDSFSFNTLPHIRNENKEAIPVPRFVSDFENLCADISTDSFNQSIKSSFSCCSENGSLWTNTLKNPICFHIKQDGQEKYYELNIDGHYTSLALIPIRAAEAKIGFLIFKSVKLNLLNPEKIDFYECIMQIFGNALINRRAQIALRERVKELASLYKIGLLAEQPDSSVDNIVKGVVEIIPHAMFYPDISFCRVVLDEMVYLTPGFQEGPQRLTSELIIYGIKRGIIEVTYSREMPEIYEGPFLREERSLIDAVANELSLIIERRQSSDEKKKLEKQLRHADRLATIGQLSSGVAHELNEPLGNILGFAQLAQKHPGLPKQINDDLEKIISASLHAREVIKKLLFFARQMPARKEPVNLNKIIDELYFLQSRCKKEGVELAYHLAPDLPAIEADPSQIYQVIVNLMVNAIQSMPKGGKLTLGTNRAKEGYVSLTVEDTGTGMSKEVIKQIFVPFFTTKEVGHGTGLGLSVVHGIVTAHGGQIKVQSKPGQGSRFEVILPIKNPLAIEMN